MYASGKYSVAQVTQWHLDRIARYDSVYKSFLHVDSAGALAAARALDAAKRTAGTRFSPAPLWGVPIVVKGNTSVKGLVTSNGWEGYLIPGHELIAPADAPVIAKLKAAGAVILGHTNLPDFAAADTTISSAGGRTGNAYNWRFSPGGSSGGTATAVALSFAVLGTGTDTSNSIRLPSGASGLVGVLPTRGLDEHQRYSSAGLASGQYGADGAQRDGCCDRAHRNVGRGSRDFRTRGSSAKAQPGPYTRYLKKDALKGKRFGVPAFIANDPALRTETRSMFMKAVEGLRSAGATVVFDDAILPANFESLTEGSQHPALSSGRPRALPSEISALRNTAPPRSTPEPWARRYRCSLPMAPLRELEKDPLAEDSFFAPQRRALDRVSGDSRTFSTGWLCLSRPANATQRRNDSPARWRPERRTAYAHGLDQHHRCACRCCPRRFLSQWVALRSGVFCASVERRGPARLGVRIRAGDAVPEAACVDRQEIEGILKGSLN